MRLVKQMNDKRQRRPARMLGRKLLAAGVLSCCHIMPTSSALITTRTSPALTVPLHKRNRQERLLFMSEPTLAQQGLSVALDQPLLLDPVAPIVTGPPRLKLPKIELPKLHLPKLEMPQVTALDWKLLKKTLMGYMASNTFRVSLLVVTLILTVSLLSRRVPALAESGAGDSLTSTVNVVLTRIKDAFSTIYKAITGRYQRVVDRIRRSRTRAVGTPMPFDYSNDNDGWGVCSLRSKRRLGRSSFVQYEFDLPEPDYVLPLELGQQISLCCLDNENNVAKGDFFPYSANPTPQPGTFSILAPNRTPSENEFAIGDDAANFVRVLKQDLKVGDEVALKPGANRLSYRGQYLPVTDMMYVACGTGIVPVMDQIRMVLPSDSSSSVGSVTVVWINENTNDFDVTSQQLEREYFKYNTKLAVSCIVDETAVKGETSFDDNVEIAEAVPTFVPGTMAVLSGPKAITEKAIWFLEDRGYPRDCICTL